MTDVSTNTDVILVNTVLTFLQYGLNTATVQNVLKVASSTFSMKEVKTAVSMLWKSCDLGNVPNLRGSNNRTQCRVQNRRSLLAKCECERLWSSTQVSTLARNIEYQKAKRHRCCLHYDLFIAQL